MCVCACVSKQPFYLQVYHQEPATTGKTELTDVLISWFFFSSFFLRMHKTNLFKKTQGGLMRSSVFTLPPQCHYPEQWFSAGSWGWRWLRWWYQQGRTRSRSPDTWRTGNMAPGCSRPGFRWRGQRRPEGGDRCPAQPGGRQKTRDTHVVFTPIRRSSENLLGG